MSVNSEEYAIRFGGIWLEFHERIVAAEGNFARLEAERDAARAERDAVITEKEKLEAKYRENVASLTAAETGHLEARQIFEQVREEHRDMSRRCLAAEAHTEWLDDQLRQQKAIRSMKEEEVEALNYRIGCLKAEVAEGQQDLARTQAIVAAKDEEIAALVATTKAKSEELIVLTRALHSKDKQIALLVKERNGLKEDLAKAQHSLAIARRKESSLKQRTAAQELAERTTSVTSAQPASAAKLSPATTAVEVAASPNTATKVDVLPESSSAETVHPADGTSTSNVDKGTEVSIVGATLRKYKAMRVGGCNSGTKAARPMKAGNLNLSHSVLLEDILDSVLSDPSNDDACTSNVCVGQCAGAATDKEAEPEETRKQLFQTPKRAWMDSSDGLAPGNAVEPLTASTAAALLNDSDLHFIDSVLDTSATLVEAGVGTVELVHSDGAMTPVRAKGGSRRTVAAVRTPETVRELYRPSGSSASSVSSTTTTVARAEGGHKDAAVPVACLQSELEAHKQRERDYKAALYLLQEEVRHLRAQMAEHDAMKRNIRLATPKGAGMRKKAGHDMTVPAAPTVGAKPVKNRGCVRKLEFSSLA